MKKWEYKWVLTHCGIDENDVASTLNKLGNEGWRVVTGDFDSMSGILMEREIPEPPTDEQIDQLVESLASDCQSRESPEPMADKEFNRRANLIIGVR